MKKTVLIRAIILMISLIPFLSQGQKRNASGAFKNYVPGLAIVELNACDSIGWPPPASYDLTWYNIGSNAGYISGTNFYNDKEKGNYFNLSGTTGTYVLRAMLGLGPVNSKLGGDLTRPINIKVYDGTSGTPGNLLSTFPISLQEMINRKLAFSMIVFPSPILLPASKKIFITVDILNLNWVQSPDPTNKDTLSLLSTADGDPSIPLAWERWADNSWHTVESSWNSGPGTPGIKINHHIYPLVSTDATGCNTLPVTFGNFTANQTSLGIDLKWQTWTEINSDRFEVERSDDSQKFISIGIVKSKAINGQHHGLKSYQFIDPTAGTGTIFYRIKQVDKDGAHSFTKTVKVTITSGDENQMIRAFYPNPANDRLFVQLNNGIKQVENIKVMDPSGKIMVIQKPAVSPDGIMNISTRGLKSGLHFVTIFLPDGMHKTIKFMKD